VIGRRNVLDVPEIKEERSRWSSEKGIGQGTAGKEEISRWPSGRNVCCVVGERDLAQKGRKSSRLLLITLNRRGRSQEAPERQAILLGPPGDVKLGRRASPSRGCGAKQNYFC